LPIIERVLRACSTDVDALVVRGLLLIGSSDRLGDAIRDLELAVELDPFSIRVYLYLIGALVRAGRADEARTRCQEALELEPNHPSVLWFQGQSEIIDSSFDKGLALIEDALQRAGGDNILIMAALGWGYGRAGRVDEARRILAELESRSASHYVSAYVIAKVHAGLGDADAAFEWLEKAWDEPGSMLLIAATDECFAHLRDDPRFKNLTSRWLPVE
jgi:Flp pilus assembly protein TadD